jgi:tetratricopeptide (TPR) repeat protein
MSGTPPRRRLPALAAALLAGGSFLAAAGPPAEKPWARVNAPHFVVSGDVGAEDVREVAVLLELFREVFLRVLPGARDRSLLPPFVVVFGGDKAFAPYKPLYDGKAAPVGGYAVHEPLAPLMALRLDQSQEAYRTIFHEYAHILFDNPDAPLWLSEGVADYYSTATVHRDRRRVLIGGRVPGLVSQMSRAWVPLQEVLTTARSARIWYGPAGRSFYAQSWALVHYLTRGTPARGAQISRFLERLAHGESEASAFEQAIGPPARVEGELRRYVGAGMAPPEEVVLPAQVGIEPLRGRPMSAAEVEATLGRVLFQLQRDAEALSRLNAAVGLDPDISEAHVTIGLLRLREGDPEGAIGPFRQASRRDPSNVLAAYNYALVSLQAHDRGNPADLEHAYTALGAVIRRDGPAEPLAVLGTIAGRLGRLDEAEPLLRRAAELAPTRFPTQIELVDLCIRTGKFDEARQILSSAAARAGGDQVGIVDQRRRWLSMAEQRASLRAELAAAAGLPEAGPDPAVRAAGVFPTPPELRELRDGEERAAGLLDAVDCSGPGAVAKITTKSGALALFAPSLSGVYIATARADVGAVLTCGARENREAVYVTWTAGQRLVAIEFLPMDYQPEIKSSSSARAAAAGTSP